MVAQANISMTEKSVADQVYSGKLGIIENNNSTIILSAYGAGSRLLQ